MATKRELELEHDMRLGWLIAFAGSGLVWMAVIAVLTN